jgi:excisionase family DNA binding protein
MSAATATSPPDTNSSRMLTRAEAAEFLGVRPQTLAVWSSTGRYSLPFARIGRCVRYRLADLQKFVEARTATSTGQLDAAE